MYRLFPGICPDFIVNEMTLTNAASHVKELHLILPKISYNDASYDQKDECQISVVFIPWQCFEFLGFLGEHLFLIGILRNFLFFRHASGQTDHYVGKQAYHKEQIGFRQKVEFI